jgi:hypothetical protein
LTLAAIASRSLSKTDGCIHIYKAAGFGILGALLFLPLVAMSAFWGRIRDFVDH